MRTNWLGKPLQFNDITSGRPSRLHFQILWSLDGMSIDAGVSPMSINVPYQTALLLSFVFHSHGDPCITWLGVIAWAAVTKTEDTE